MAGTLAHGAQFTLTWKDNSTNETGFRIERAAGLNATSGFVQIATVGANIVSYVDAGLPNSTSYSYRLRAYNSAGSSGYSNLASGTTPSSTSNTAPSISGIADQTLGTNGTTGPLAFRISDAQTAASSLTLSRNSSNRTLVPLENITFGGSGTNRTVTIRPAYNKTGYTTVWVKVSDGSLTRHIEFLVMVVAGGNTAPTISRIGDRTIAVNGSTGPIAFNIGDGQSGASSLTLVRNVSNTAIIPLANVSFGGSGTNRTVTIRPSTNRTGWSTVWVKVSDGKLDTYTSFVVQVAASLTYAQIAPITGAIVDSSQTLLAAATTAPGSTDSDPMRFGYMSLADDTELTVRVETLGGTSDALRAGLMIRGSTAADAACAGVHVTGDGRLEFVSRANAGGAFESSTPLPGGTPHYLRLTRSGGVVYGFASKDGVTWDLVEYAPVALPSTALAGTVVMAPSEAEQSAVTFSGLTVD